MNVLELLAMSATHVETVRSPVGAAAAGVRDTPAERGVLFVADVPRPVLRALSMLGAERDLSRSGYVRELVERHVRELGP